MAGVKLRERARRLFSRAERGGSERLPVLPPKKLESSVCPQAGVDRETNETPT
jgi:hypothetical protein